MTPKRSELIRAQVPLGSAGPKGTVRSTLDVSGVGFGAKDRGLLEIRKGS